MKASEEVVRRRKMAFSIRRCANLVAFHMCTIFRVINSTLELSSVLHLNDPCFEISNQIGKIFSIEFFSVSALSLSSP